MLKLEEKTYALDGVTYKLRCNMSVLETIEEQAGDMESFLAQNVRAASLELLAAMLNDSAEEQGLEIRWTPAMLKRRFSHAMLMELDTVGMLIRALTPPGQQHQETPAAGAPADDAGN